MYSRLGHTELYSVRCCMHLLHALLHALQRLGMLARGAASENEDCTAVYILLGVLAMIQKWGILSCVYVSVRIREGVHAHAQTDTECRCVCVRAVTACRHRALAHARIALLPLCLLPARNRGSGRQVSATTRTLTRIFYNASYNLLDLVSAPMMM